MDWNRDLPGWPLSRLSRRVLVRPHDWHVQETGEGETLLLLHGVGASTHTWRDLIPIFARRYHVVAIDLPGQGFTRMGSRQRCGLDPMAEDIGALCRACGWSPAAIIGHSAGAALALRLARDLERDRGTAPLVVGINPALGHFEGLAGWLFPVFAKVLSATPLTARIFSMGSARPSRVRSLIGNTGSTLSDEGVALYARLIGDRDHVDATLKMMAHWSLDGLLADLPRLSAHCLFVTGANDAAVPPETAERAARRMPHARTLSLPALGHLAHEEAPETVAQVVLDYIDDTCCDHGPRTG
jgi:magnesium chelatase accessory protein